MTERYDDGALVVYTDGCCLPSPRRGGIGFLILGEDVAGEEELHQFSPNGYPGATNQEMEIKACSEALRVLGGPRAPVEVNEYRKVVVCTDSQFVWKHHKTALYQWQSNSWKRADGLPVANGEYWDELISLIFKVSMPVVFEWVKGKKDRYTRLVDRLAKGSAERPYARPLSYTSVRRSQSGQPVDPGGVKVAGQEVVIYVRTVKRMHRQNSWRLKYEVASRERDDAGRADFAFAREVLRDGRYYRVRFGDGTDKAWIEEVLSEVDRP